MPKIKCARAKCGKKCLLAGLEKTHNQEIRNTTQCPERNLSLPAPCVLNEDNESMMNVSTDIEDFTDKNSRKGIYSTFRQPAWIVYQSEERAAYPVLPPYQVAGRWCLCRMLG